jgi:hypothetical protein
MSMGPKRGQGEGNGEALNGTSRACHFENRASLPPHEVEKICSLYRGTEHCPEGHGPQVVCIPARAKWVVPRAFQKMGGWE